MEKELGSDVIKTTQSTLGKFVKRPPLSEKLLRKPPFRFLHDIVTTVLKTTGFFNGLFEENELVSDNVKDRESKILFLNKVIAVISLATGKSLSAKPTKIVAGQEPEKTNELLQCLAYALDNKISSDEAVNKFKEGAQVSQSVETKPKENVTVKKNHDTNKLTSRSSEKLTATKETVNKTKTSEIKSKKKESEAKNESLTKKTQIDKKVKKQSSTDSKSQFKIIKSHNRNTSVTKQTSSDISDSEMAKPQIDRTAEREISETFSGNQSSSLNLSKAVEDNFNNVSTNNESDLNSSLSSQDLMRVENEQTDDKQFSENQTVNTIEAKIEPVEEIKQDNSLKNDDKNDSSLKIHNTDNILKSRYETIQSQEVIQKENSKTNSVEQSPTSAIKRSTEMRPSSVRPSSSRPGAPRLREKIDNLMPDNDNLLLAKVNIIAENSHNEEEEETSIIVVQDPTELRPNADEQELQSSNEHGHLVQQILDSQKELSNTTGKTEIEWQFGAQKAVETINQEIEQLRFNIQAMSRVANPLGKLLDHIQEDVEMMRQELHQWTNVYEEVTRDMAKQKSASEETLIPLQSKIKQLDIDIVEKHDKINDFKIMIHKNSSRIEKLLANGNVQ